MKSKKFLIVSMILLAIMFMGAVSAAENLNTATDDVAVDTLDYCDSLQVSDESNAGGGIILSDNSSAVDAAVGDDIKQVENSKLGASNNDALGDNYTVITPQNYYDNFDDNNINGGTYKFEGVFDETFGSLILEDTTIDGSDAVFTNIGINLMGNVQVTGLTLTSSQYLSDNDGRMVYVNNDGNTIDGVTINYAPTADDDAFGIYVSEADDFQLLNSNVNFTGVSLADYYEYAMKIENSQRCMIQGNVIRANLPILDVDYNKGNPGLDTDLVLNTGIKDSNDIDIINNSFIANVINRAGDFPTLDCIMLQDCEGVNFINNTLNETDFITEEGSTNYLNVLDMYYSSDVLVQGNFISVETNGGSEDAGTSYPIQLTGPYENVTIDGNTLYAHCGGPALGVYSQNYYGDTEILVQNNDIDVTGLPTNSYWGLVSGIELQDNIARVYNNTIVTRLVTGSFKEGMYIYGISYAQSLNDNHNYDIRDNHVETEGQYTVYLLKAQDTTVTNNYLVSSTGGGDSTVYIRDASGNTVVMDNYPNDPENVVTQDNFYDFFDDEGILSTDFDELIFKGDFSNLVEHMTIEQSISIIGDNATLYDMGFIIKAGSVSLDDLTFIAEGSHGSIISVSEADNIQLTNLGIYYEAADEEATAIDVYSCKNVTILDNTIFFESHVLNDTLIAVALQMVGCSNCLVDGNDITTKLPCVYVYCYDEDYYMMGSNNVNPVRLKDVGNLVFTNNFINSTTNNYSADFPTIQSIYIIGCSDSLIDHNNISMIDEMTPAGLDNYLYGIDFGYNYNVTFSYNNFIMSTKGGLDAAGTAYAFQGVESTVYIVGNNITSISNGPNLGIYVASMFGGDSTLYIADNFINVTGSASHSGSWALVSGIEIQNGDAQIYNNTIYAYNVNEYDDTAYMYGISYAQWMYGDRSFDIQNNTVFTEGKYTISVINATFLIAEGNTLYAHKLSGDDSINPGVCPDVTIKDNLPEKELNVVTNDTFYDFFDENGNLLSSIIFDELIFNGAFSDLSDMIVFNRAINVTGDDAVLNNIAVRIASDNVTFSDFTLNADKEFADNNGALIYATGADIEVSEVVVNYNAPSEVEAIGIYANVANNFKLLDSSINYTSTNPGSKHNYALEVRNSENVLIDDNFIGAVLPAVDVDYSGSGIDTDLVLAVGIQGGEDVYLTNNIVIVNTNGGIGSYPTVDAIMIHSVDNVILRSNNIAHYDATTSDAARYYYSVDIYNSNATIFENDISVNTTSGIARTGTAYPIQLTGPFMVIVANNNLTAISKGPTCGIYASNWNGIGDLTVTDNTIDVTGYSVVGGYALVSGIEAEIEVASVYNNIINVANFADYNDTNPVYGVSMTSSYMSGTPAADIKDNTITVDGKYAVYYLKAVNSNVTDNTLYAHELTGDAAAVIASGDNNIIENNLPGPAQANMSIIADAVWIGSDATVTVSVTNATGTVTIEINNKSYVVDLVDGIATQVVVAEDLVVGENIITATYSGPEFANATASGSLYVLDGVVTQDTYLYYFNQEDNGKLFDYIPEGATLDFQGSIINPDTNIIVQMNVNKPVNIVSTTGDAYVDLNTTAGSLLGESPGNSFAVTNGGSGSNVTGIYFHNTQIWITNTHDVVLDNISVVVEDQRVGSGVGATSIRDNSSNVILKNSYLYTRNNGGSTTFTMSWATNCTIDNCTVKAEGNVGNLIYLNIFNIVGAPSGVPLNNYNKVINNRIYGKEGSGISVGLMVEGQYNLIENNTLYKSSISTSFGGVNPYNNTYDGNTLTDGGGLTAQVGSIVYNNNVTGALSTGKESVAFDNIVGKGLTVGQDAVAYNNTVAATMSVNAGGFAYYNAIGTTATISGKSAVVENNTIGGAVTISGAGVTFIGNDVNGTVTVKSNGNVIEGNNITTTGTYAVDLTTKTDNNVTYNYLVASVFKGDKAVKSASETNIVENNFPVAEITIAADAVWIGSDATVTVSVPDATGTVTIEINNKSYVVDLVDGIATQVVASEDLVVGENIITATYSGPEFANATASGSLYVLDGVVTQDTYLYYFNQEDNGKLFDYIPEGATLDFQGSIINPDQAIIVQMNVNKPVNIVSTTGDAYVDLNTTAGSLLGDSPGNSFAVSNGGSGSNVTGIYFHNTQIWITNTHDVVLDNISVVVEDQRVGSGVGATSIRDNSSNVILKNSYLYTRNNGGSTTFTMSWATNCTIDNCTVKAEGNVGNLIYLNIFNIVGAPSGVPLNNYNKVINNRIYGKEGSGISVGLMVEGQYNLIENNTLYKSSISTSFGGVNPYNNTYDGNTLTDGGGLTAQVGSIVYNNNVTGALSTGKESVAFNNIVGKGLTVGQDAVAYNNTVAATISVGVGGFAYDNVIGTTATISGKGAVVENNTIGGAVTISGAGVNFIGNDVNGTVTVKSNGNVIEGNNITATGTYAVDLTTKTDNNVTYNYLIAAELKGDDAVNSASETNIVENNFPAKVTISVIAEAVNYGENVIVNVTGTADGIYTVTVDGVTQEVNVVAGEYASVDFGVLDVNEYQITAVFNETEYYLSAVNDTEVAIVNKADATITIAADNIAYGDVLVVNVTSNADGEYIITVNDESVTVSVVDGVGSAEFSDLAVGTYDIVAAFAGDDNYNNASADAVVKVTKATPEITVTADNVVYGDDLLVIVEMSTDVARRPTVTIGNESKAVTMRNGAGTVKFSGLAAGTYDVVVSYNGDSNYAKTTVNTTAKVTRATPEITVSADNIAYGDDLVVNVELPSDVTRRATVTIGDESKLVSLVDGVGSVKFSGLSVGTHTITVSYNGDSNYAKASVNTTVKVNRGPADIQVTANPVSYGEDVIIDVQLPSDVTRRASVTIGNETKLVSLVNGSGSIKFSGLAVGTHDVRVEYAGDSNYVKSSINTTVKVNKATPDIQITAEDINYGETLTVGVQLPADVSRRALVTIDGNIKKYASLKDGIGSVKFTGLSEGTHEVIVSYDGDANYKKASNSTTITVKK